MPEQDVSQKNFHVQARSHTCGCGHKMLILLRDDQTVTPPDVMNLLMEVAKEHRLRFIDGVTGKKCPACHRPIELGKFEGQGSVPWPIATDPFSSRRELKTFSDLEKHIKSLPWEKLK